MLDRLVRKSVGLGLLVGGGVWFGSALVSPTPAAAFEGKKAAGAELFATRGCAHCHGNDGQGTEKAPGLHDLRKKMSADKVQEQIVHGGNGMPAFGDSLKPDEVNDLVAFLRAKKWITPPAPPLDTPPTSAQSATPSPGK